jgi:hypothetical protein
MTHRRDELVPVPRHGSALPYSNRTGQVRGGATRKPSASDGLRRRRRHVGQCRRWRFALCGHELASKGQRAGRCHRLILSAASAAHSDCADDRPFAAQRDATGEDHNPSMIGIMDAIELLAGLGVFREIGGRDIERARRKGLVDRDLPIQASSMRT